VLVDTAIYVLKNNSNPTVIIVGETTPKFCNYQNRLQAKIERAGLSKRIIFHGKQPSTALPGLFQGMSIVAALSRNEGFGLTVPEAMASGCAVLASHAGAWQDIIADGLHGFTVPVDDLKATQASLEKLLDADLEKMGSAGREHVKMHYTIQREAKSLVNFYQKILHKESSD